MPETEADNRLITASLSNDEERALKMILYGSTITEAYEQTRVPPARLRALTKTEKYEEMQKTSVEDIKEARDQTMLRAQLTAARTVAAAVEDDPALALKLLEKTGSLQEQAKVMGQQVEEKQGPAVRMVVINAHGAHIEGAEKPGPKTVDVEARTVDSGESGVD